MSEPRGRREDRRGRGVPPRPGHPSPLRTTDRSRGPAVLGADRLWRGKLPECFAKVYLDDPTRFEGVRKFDLRRRTQRSRLYELLLRKGQPEELIDWIDGALLVDLWEDLRMPAVIRKAWQPVVTVAGSGPREHPRYGPTA